MAGCATPKPPPIPRTGDPVVDDKAEMRRAPQRDRVLWEYRIAAAAMRQGRYDVAKQELDDALGTIGGIIANDKNAKRARSLFHEEARKTFLGEPYERVMAYFYRGILYWMDGEPDNARACFRSGQLEDSDTEHKQYAGDYVLLDYLDGLATVKLGGDGSDAFKRAQSRSKFNLPPYDPKANVLVFVEFGHGPTKFATGPYHEELRFQLGHSQALSARVTVENQSALAEPYDDLNYQATTRGGRVMDHILANKAVFKSTTDTAGNVGLIGGAVLATDRDTQDIGLGLLAAGLISKLFSAATTPAADVRAWDNLPLYLGFVALRLPPGPHIATVEFLDPGGRPIANRTKTVTIDVSAVDKDTVVFVSDQA
ncbi:MAG: hypothetical protein KGS61_07915 [Verrucomicrobia bacterium]|nr:hypothetical protein [Verrucomicrobiota bacterium]